MGLVLIRGASTSTDLFCLFLHEKICCGYAEAVLMSYIHNMSFHEEIRLNNLPVQLKLFFVALNLMSDVLSIGKRNVGMFYRTKNKQKILTNGLEHKKTSTMLYIIFLARIL